MNQKRPNLSRKMPTPKNKNPMQRYNEWLKTVTEFQKGIIKAQFVPPTIGKRLAEEERDRVRQEILDQYEKQQQVSLENFGLDLSTNVNP